MDLRGIFGRFRTNNKPRARRPAIRGFIFLVSDQLKSVRKKLASGKYRPRRLWISRLIHKNGVINIRTIRHAISIATTHKVKLSNRAIELIPARPDFDSLLIGHPSPDYHPATLFVDGLPKSIGLYDLTSEPPIFEPTPFVILDIAPNRKVSLKDTDTGVDIECIEFRWCDPSFQYNFQTKKYHPRVSYQIFSFPLFLNSKRQSPKTRLREHSFLYDLPYLGC